MWLALIVWYLFNFALVRYKGYDFPKPLNDIQAGNHKFSEERGRKTLHGLTSLGVRIVGSEANEQKAVQFIMNELEKIKSSSQGRIKIDLQETSGAFHLDFLGGFTNVYDKVKNIVVRLSSDASHDRPACLVNCHYDSAPTSPGASDDAVSCASMMEVLRVMSHRTSLKHDVIFLFNGAEETILQASHGFVTQHAWFKDVKVFINLEAAGSNGKEMLFQATAEADWVIELFASEAPDPHLSVLGQEIFESGAIPSDTDFRIFRDFGNIQGIDMAYTRNGYVYHTRHDNHHQISPGCMQRSGENLLSLVLALATSPALTNPRKAEEKSGRQVFMDLSGLATVIFPSSRLFTFNILIILLSLLKVTASLKFSDYRRGLMLTFPFLPATWVASLVVPCLIGLFLDVIGRPMSWYSQPCMLFPLYALPSLAVNVFSVNLFKHYWSRHITPDHSLVAPLLNDTYLVYFASLLALLTFFKIASSIIITLIVVFFLLQSLSFSISPSSLSINFSSPALILHFLFSLPSIFLLSFTTEGLLSTFVPIMGRSGSTLPCDVVLATLVSIIATCFFSLHITVVSTMTHLKKVIITMTAITSIFVLFIAIGVIGHPFSDSSQHPTNKRIYMQHLRRRFHGDAWSSSKVAMHEDNSLCLIPLDRTTLNHLGQPHSFDGFALRPCLDQPYCGWALHLPAIHMVHKVFYKEAPPLQVPGVSVTFSPPVISNHSIQYSFVLKGVHYMNLYASVEGAYELLNWKQGRVDPTLMPTFLSNRTHYFLAIISASTPPSPHHFHFTLKCPAFRSCKLGLVQLAVVSSQFDTPTSPTLISTLHNLYTSVAPLTSESTYDSWII